jgi:hypothetical protein
VRVRVRHSRPPGCRCCCRFLLLFCAFALLGPLWALPDTIIAKLNTPAVLVLGMVAKGLGSAGNNAGKARPCAHRTRACARVCVRVRAHCALVHAPVRLCMRLCVRACVRACMYIMGAGYPDLVADIPPGSDSTTATMSAMYNAGDARWCLGAQ